MVLIINGEIVSDDDPRAVAQRGRKASASSQSGSRARGVQTLHDPPARDGRAGGAGDAAGGNHAPPNYEADGPLAPVAQWLGLAGKAWIIPPVPQLNFQGNIPGKSAELIGKLTRAAPPEQFLTSTSWPLDALDSCWAGALAACSWFLPSPWLRTASGNSPMHTHMLYFAIQAVSKPHPRPRRCARAHFSAHPRRLAE